MSEATTTPPPFQPAPLDTPTTIDLDSIPNQIGSAILSPDGTLLRPPSGSLTEKDVAIIYRMMMEVGTVLEGEGMERVTIGFSGVSYVVGVGGDGCLYIVKKRSSS